MTTDQPTTSPNRARNFAVIMLIFLLLVIIARPISSRPSPADVSMTPVAYDGITYLVFLHPTGGMQIINYSRDSSDRATYLDDQFMMNRDGDTDTGGMSNTDSLHFILEEGPEMPAFDSLFTGIGTLIARSMDGK